jgi:hypothetical protein
MEHILNSDGTYSKFALPKKCDFYYYPTKAEYSFINKGEIKGFLSFEWTDSSQGFIYRKVVFLHSKIHNSCQIF